MTPTDRLHAATQVGKPNNMERRMTLPDIELVSAKIHASWIDQKLSQGITSRKSESGEELIAPYELLSEAAKELDRATVRAVYAAIEQAK